MPNSLSRATVSQRVRRRTQRLRRDTARVQARSAEVGAFDEGDFNSGFRGGECGGVTSGAAPMMVSFMTRSLPCGRYAIR